MEIGDLLRYTHSGVRWLVVLATVIALLWMIYGVVTRRDYDKNSYRIMTTFSSLVGLQWVIGLVFMLYLATQQGAVTGFQWSHAGMMTLLLAVAHVHMMLKKRPDRVRFIGGLASIVVALIIVYFGVALLPQGWAL